MLKTRRQPPMRDNFGKLLFGGIALLVVLVVGCCAAWLTHVITCLLVGKWGFLLAGAFLFPIAIIHGVMIWFGYGY